MLEKTERAITTGQSTKTCKIVHKTQNEDTKTKQTKQHTHKIRGEPKLSRMVSSSCYYITPAVQLIVKSNYKNLVGERRKSKNYVKWKRFIAIWEMNIS